MNRARDEIRSRLSEPLACCGAPPCVLDALAEAVTASIQPALCIERLVLLFELPSRAQQLVDGLRRDLPLLASILCNTVVQSTFLFRTLEREPHLLGWLAENQTVRFTTSREIYRKELTSLLAEAAGDAAQEAAVLRRFHRRETFRIGVRDVQDMADIYTTALELSFLADVLTEAACAIALRNTTSLHGIPRHADGSPASMAVIALGKLGGEELNFCSDVDLAFITSGDGSTGGERDVPGARSIDNERFFTRVAQQLIALLSQPTQDGIVYRVDTRLRPEGRQGSLVRTLAAAETYFEAFGAEWERQALLKARVVAGDTALGQQFIERIAPFTYRKYVDEVAVAETLYSIRELRLKTFARYSDPAQLARDVKNGPGGIRDIEFTVQAIQMLIGGRYPEVRLPSTFRSLERIYQSGQLPSKDYQTLRDSYRFLRRVEHRIQMEQSSQCYQIPSTREGLDLLGRRLGFPDGDTFWRAYQVHTAATRAIFDRIFFESRVQDDVEVLLTTELPKDTYGAALAKYGLAGADWVPDLLRGLTEDEQAPHLNSKLRRLLRQLLPRILTCVRDAPDPPLAIRNMARMIRAVSANARVTFFTALREQPKALEMIVTVAGSSRFLTELLATNPHRLERLLSPLGLEPFETEADVRARWLAFQPAERPQPEQEESERIWRLRRWNGWELVRLGVAFLLGLVGANKTYRHLSLLAECVLQEVLADQIERMTESLGIAPLPAEAFGLTLIGLGKFGGEECTFGSDLDVLFVYDGVPQWYAEVGHQFDRPLDEVYTRTAQRVLRTMNFSAGGERLYETDARLRPYGRNSPLVLPLERYRDYYGTKGEVWERLMLTRARYVAGDPQCGRAFEQLAREVVTCAPWDSQTALAVRRMRERIETAKSDHPIKAGYGGMIDVEFLAQAAQLRFGREHPEICHPSTMETLRALAGAGLMPTIDLATVAECYEFLRNMETALRVVDNVSHDSLPTDPEHLASLVRRIYLPQQQTPPSIEAVMAEYEIRRQRIRAAFSAFLESA